MAPRIRSRRTIDVSPWIHLIEREVEFTPDKLQTYHSVGQPDYVSILAMTPDRKIPLVRQFRPAVERVTWELPAGLVDAGEDPAETCKRELLEETGHPALRVQSLGATDPCTGRMSNRLHSFFVETGERAVDFKPEAGIEIELKTLTELTDMIRTGEFDHQLHIGTVLQAALRGCIDLHLKG
jgi:ADP-ribose pyrophosphatase